MSGAELPVRSIHYIEFIGVIFDPATLQQTIRGKRDVLLLDREMKTHLIPVDYFP